MNVADTNFAKQIAGPRRAAAKAASMKSSGGARSESDQGRSNFVRYMHNHRVAETVNASAEKA